MVEEELVFSCLFWACPQCRFSHFYEVRIIFICQWFLFPCFTPFCETSHLGSTVGLGCIGTSHKPSRWPPCRQITAYVCVACLMVHWSLIHETLNTTPTTWNATWQAYVAYTHTHIHICYWRHCVLTRTWDNQKRNQSQLPPNAVKSSNSYRHFSRKASNLFLLSLTLFSLWCQLWPLHLSMCVLCSGH